MDEKLFQARLGALWSKTDRANPQRYHLLHYHLLDTAAVALKLWESALAGSVRSEVSAWLQLDENQAGRQIACWTALHDIGKASPVFQGSVPARAAAIRETGLSIKPDLSKKLVYHSQVSGRFLREHKLAPLEVDVAISGHHGQWNADYDFSPAYYGDTEWDTTRLRIAENIREIMQVKQIPCSGFESDSTANCFTVWLSGFVTIADWVASNEEYFFYSSDLVNTQAYFSSALEKAADTLQRLGWVGWKPQGRAISFLEMYPWMKSPRPVQAEIVQAYDHYHPEEPFIAIIEAPTGIGKTEIAFYLADRWLQETNGSGLYIAMPTQATSNQIYQRSLDILQNRYPQALIPVTLAHGQAAWNETVNAIRVKEIGEQNEGQSVLAAEWFQNNRKRTLLTPFGVGTVDQAFMSILQTRHFFVRLFGLKDKVVIFDEVHAYDAYMNELFYRLLNWLHGMGAAVIILSATLPDQARREILAAYLGRVVQDIPGDRQYPRLTFSSAKKEVIVTGLTPPEERRLALTWIETEGLVEALQSRLQDGGCAAVICNTVGRAQEVYTQLQKSGLLPEENLILFHARFPLAWRADIESLVLKKFGKAEDGSISNPNRPARAVVVATQVIEQSLDLDFDVLFSELAPVDLILQRAGRLHRHAGRMRPHPLEQPQLFLFRPQMGLDGFPNFGGSGFIYGAGLLWRTWEALRSEGSIHTIRDTRELIERVYGPIDPEKMDESFSKRLSLIERKEKEEQERTRSKARSMLVARKEDEGLLFAASLALKEDDDPELHQSYRALTRDIGPSLSIICLHQAEDGRLFLEPDGSGQPIDLNTLQENYTLLKQVLRMSVNIQILWAIKIILSASDVIRTMKISPLRYSIIIPFRNGKYTHRNFMMELSPTIGLKMSRIQ